MEQRMKPWKNIDNAPELLSSRPPDIVRSAIPVFGRSSEDSTKTFSLEEGNWTKSGPQTDDHQVTTPKRGTWPRQPLPAVNLPEHLDRSTDSFGLVDYKTGISGLSPRSVPRGLRVVSRSIDLSASSSRLLGADLPIRENGLLAEPTEDFTNPLWSNGPKTNSWIEGDVVAGQGQRFGTNNVNPIMFSQDEEGVGLPREMMNGESAKHGSSFNTLTSNSPTSTQTGTGQTHLGLGYTLKNTSLVSENRCGIPTQLFSPSDPTRNQDTMTTGHHHGCHAGSNETAFSKLVQAHPSGQHRNGKTKVMAVEPISRQNATTTGTDWTSSSDSSSLFNGKGSNWRTPGVSTDTDNNLPRSYQYSLSDGLSSSQNRVAGLGLFPHQTIVSRPNCGNSSFSNIDRPIADEEVVRSTIDVLQSKNKMMRQIFDSKYDSRKNLLGPVDPTKMTAADITKTMAADDKRFMIDHHKSWIQMEEKLLNQIYDLQRERKALRHHIEELTAKNRDLAGKLERAENKLEKKERNIEDERRQLREKILALVEFGKPDEQKSRIDSTYEEEFAVRRLNANSDKDDVKRGRQVAQEDLAACQFRFSIEREKWMDEKSKVVRYQRLLQTKYEQILAESAFLKMKIDCRNSPN